MKPSDNFQKIIYNHLESLASKDSLFAETLKKPNKNIEDCIKYIFNQVQKSGRNGFVDEEIYGMAVHYYDEDDIKVDGPVNMNVVVNHKVELSEEEIKEAKRKALDEVLMAEKEKLLKKSANKKAEPIQVVQASLF